MPSGKLRPLDRSTYASSIKEEADSEEEATGKANGT